MRLSISWLALALSFAGGCAKQESPEQRRERVIEEIRQVHGRCRCEIDSNGVNVSFDHAPVTEPVLIRLATNELGPVRSIVVDGGTVSAKCFQILESFDQLDQLYLNNSPVSDADLVLISRLKGLRELSLRRTDITNNGLKQLQSLPQLRKLYLAQTKIGDQGLEHLKSMKQLQALYLAGTPITDEGLAHLAALTNLRSLDLSGTRVEGSGLVHLRSLSQLRYLDLSRTKVTDWHMGPLKELTVLDTLNLESTQVTNRGESDLRGALPDTAIFISFPPPRFRGSSNRPANRQFPGP